MSLHIVRRGRLSVEEFILDVSPGQRVEVLDDAGRVVLHLAPERGDPEYTAATGDTTTHRAFVTVARDVLVCDQRGSTVHVAGVRLQLDH